MTQLAFPKTYKRGSTLDSSMFYMGSLFSFLAKGADTGGRHAMIEYQSKPSRELPPYVNEWEHEMYYVLEGTLEFYCEAQVLVVSAGEVMFLPQGKAHAFYICSPYVRALLLVQAVAEHPIGLDRYLIELGKPATSMELPAHAIAELSEDYSHSVRVGTAYGIRVLSPEETAQELPYYPGFGIKRKQIEDVASSPKC